MMEKVISNLMETPSGLPRELISQRYTDSYADYPVKAFITPTLPQAKANKCLIALVGKKLVTKSSVGVSGIVSGLGLG
jgi:hypothetical protein